MRQVRNKGEIIKMKKVKLDEKVRHMFEDVEKNRRNILLFYLFLKMNVRQRNTEKERRKTS